MIRKILGSMVLLIIALYVVIQIFGTKMAAGAIENATGFPASVNRVHLKLVPLEFGIYGVKVKAKNDFEEQIASIPAIFVRIKLSSLFKGVLHIQSIELDLKEVNVEKTKDGRVNLKEIFDRAQKKEKQPPAESTPSKPETSAPHPPKKSPQLKTQIDEAVISLGSVSYIDYGAGQRTVRQLNLNIRDEKLNNVSDPFDLTQQITLLILKRIGVGVLGMQINALASSAIEDAKNTLTGLFK